jgi:uroporphyrinogen-III synthase
VFEHSALDVDVVPGRNVAEGLVDALGPPAKGADRLLLVQAEVARDTLERGLTAAGWVVERVVAYRTVDAAIDDDARRRLGDADVILFTSSSTVERFVRLVGLDALPPTVASIGPITSSTAGDLGVHVDVEADPHTIAGLVDALAAWAGERNSSG